MYKIDLLKGQGIPMKCRPEGITIGAATVITPLLIVIIMLVLYYHSTIAIAIQKREIAGYETKISELADEIKWQKSSQTEKALYSGTLSEVASSIQRHTQWSSVLAEVVKNIPNSMILTRLEVKQRNVKKTVPRKDDPKQMVNISVPARTLQLSLCGSPTQNCDRSVREFRDMLRSSKLLGDRLEEIRFSQKAETLEGQDVVAYEIDCIFKPEL